MSRKYEVVVPVNSYECMELDVLKDHLSRIQGNNQPDELTDQRVFRWALRRLFQTLTFNEVSEIKERLKNGSTKNQNPKN